MSKAVILLADDDQWYRESLRQLLELEDYRVIEAASPEEAREKLETEHLDLALLDLRFTDHENERDISGLTMARLAATRHVRCIIITAYDTAETVRRALRSRGGEPLAEDYVPKSDDPQAVLDAIEVVLSRVNGAQEPARPAIEIDLERRLAYLNGDPLRLSRLQYRLLAYLYEQAGAVCSAQELIRAVYDETLTPAQANVDKRLERLVERVREKIEVDVHDPQLLIKEYGRGYRLVR
jgi:two-component system KDP operon response regulator KdpE